jgi:hypothetical protein
MERLQISQVLTLSSLSPPLPRLHFVSFCMLASSFLFPSFVFLVDCNFFVNFTGNPYCNSTPNPNLYWLFQMLQVKTRSELRVFITKDVGGSILTLIKNPYG